MTDQDSLIQDLTPQRSGDLPTLPLLERTLSQVIQRHYRLWTGCRPEKTVCLIRAEIVTVLIHRSLTPLEELLEPSEVQQVRKMVERKLKPLLRKVVEEVLGVSVGALMLDTDVEDAKTGAVVVLARMPIVRAAKRAQQGV